MSSDAFHSEKELLTNNSFNDGIYIRRKKCGEKCNKHWLPFTLNH